MNIHNKHIYPFDSWCIRETEFILKHNYRNETVFTLANGYLGTRGTFEESYGFNISQGCEGNYINGFYESEPVRYGEFGYGFPKTSQTMLNVANPKPIRLFIGDECFNMLEGEVLKYERTLHMDKGILTRKVTWHSPKGREVDIEVTRMVSLVDKNLMLTEYKVYPRNFEGIIRLISQINADVSNNTAKANPLIDYGPYGKALQIQKLNSAGDDLLCVSKTRNTGFLSGHSCSHIFSGCLVDKINREIEDACEVEYVIHAFKDEPAVLQKFVAVSTSLEHSGEDMESFIVGKSRNAAQNGIAYYINRQHKEMERFWNDADVEIQGNPALQQGMRFNLFHIFQSVGRDGKTSFGAKGLTGEGYEGHYFWDTEMFIAPFFSYTFPEISRALMEYRYNTLEQARGHARELGHQKGALYPWRTINGKEASCYYPTGSAQYHINADVAYSLNQYLTLTGDYTFLTQKGAEIFCETARIWADVGSFSEYRQGRYCICCVTGPDEYNAIVDNNFYTNYMARENLRFAIESLEWMEKNAPAELKRLEEKIDLQEEEIALWRKIIDNMYFNYNDELGIYAQDDTFLQKKPWDNDSVPPEKRSLLYVNYHPLFVFRHRMCKQADTVLAIVLNRDQFTQEEMQRHFDFYEPITMHHSSLSTCIFGILACEIGNYQKAYLHFLESARMDLDDCHNNVYAGIHGANMAGTWMTIVNGFAGVCIKQGKLSLSPYLPEGWEGYSFKLHYLDMVIRIHIGKEGATYSLLKGDSLEILHKDLPIVVKSGAIVHV